MLGQSLSARKHRCWCLDADHGLAHLITLASFTGTSCERNRARERRWRKRGLLGLGAQGARRSLQPERKGGSDSSRCQASRRLESRHRLSLAPLPRPTSPSPPRPAARRVSGAPGGDQGAWASVASATCRAARLMPAPRLALPRPGRRQARGSSAHHAACEIGVAEGGFLPSRWDRGGTGGRQAVMAGEADVGAPFPGQKRRRSAAEALWPPAGQQRQDCAPAHAAPPVAAPLGQAPLPPALPFRRLRVLAACACRGPPAF